MNVLDQHQYCCFVYGVVKESVKAARLYGLELPTG